MAGPLRNASKPHSRARRGPAGLPGGPRALVTLPAEGCTLPPPPMPKGRSWGPAERSRWLELWTSPQATMWDESASLTVALVVVYEASVLSGEASAWQAQELRHASASLGLTPASMAALGWRIEGEQ